MAARTPSGLSSTSLFQNRNTQYPSASRNRVRLAFRLGRAIMLPAIDLDDQSRCVAGEIGNEPADRHLAAKPIAFGLPRPQHLPETPFGFGHVTAEGPGALARTGAWRFLHHGSVLGITPTLALPHRGGGREKRSRSGTRSLRRARLGIRQADAADRL